MINYALHTLRIYFPHVTKFYRIISAIFCCVAKEVVMCVWQCYIHTFCFLLTYRQLSKPENEN